MKNRVGTIMLAAIFAATVTVQASTQTHSKSIVVESPSDLPEMAQRNSEAMYLHDTKAGQTVLYLEQDQGRTLAILDVSDLGAIRALPQVSIGARSPYDFVMALSDTVLIHYRDQSGFAIISFQRYNQPMLIEVPQFQHSAHAEALGHDGLLFGSTTRPSAQVEDPRYEVFDVSNPSKPVVLATVAKVKQRLDRQATCTVFLLGTTGLTVIRRPNVEQDHRNMMESGSIYSSPYSRSSSCGDSGLH
ncbi:MAG TPA: hypothetical protein VFI38_11830 [Candidatus Acidoferrum sp.]|nr:hypothetical protein [Candidatus Acidoferrum sp.]